ncbi:hypothetical protein [Neobacillus drentensis]
MLQGSWYHYGNPNAKGFGLDLLEIVFDCPNAERIRTGSTGNCL